MGRGPSMDMTGYVACQKASPPQIHIERDKRSNNFSQRQCFLLTVEIL